MKLGADPKKIAILAVLLLVGGYFFYSNVISDPNDSAPHQPGATAAHNAAISGIVNSTPVPRGPIVRPTARTKASEEFRPTLKRKPEDMPDVGTIDPTLRLDLLAKVQAVNLESASRNPFQFGAPPPPPPQQQVKLTKEQIAALKNPPPPPTSTKPPALPQPPVLNLNWKYYGFTSAGGATKKKAFFLVKEGDSEDILSATEGDLLRRKYRVVRIGVNSVVVEDTDTKTQQTLPLQEEAAA